MDNILPGTPFEGGVPPHEAKSGAVPFLSDSDMQLLDNQLAIFGDAGLDDANARCLAGEREGPLDGEAESSEVLAARRSLTSEPDIVFMTLTLAPIGGRTS